VASNGTVQAKTWNPNGLAAVANLPCHRRFSGESQLSSLGSTTKLADKENYGQSLRVES
jgi:hypothetical protein